MWEVGFFILAVVEEFAKKKELAIDAKKSLVTALQAKWQEMEEEYLTK